MIACFVGREALALHGAKHALTKTLDVHTTDVHELAGLIQYQREHGFKLMWVCQNGADHKALWEAMTR